MTIGTVRVKYDLSADQIHGDEIQVESVEARMGSGYIVLHGTIGRDLLPGRTPIEIRLDLNVVEAIGQFSEY